MKLSVGNVKSNKFANFLSILRPIDQPSQFLRLSIQNNWNYALKNWEMVHDILIYICAGFFCGIIKKKFNYIKIDKNHSIFLRLGWFFRINEILGTRSSIRGDISSCFESGPILGDQRSKIFFRQAMPVLVQKI